MQTVSTALANAIGAQRRTVTGRLRIDFNRSGTYTDYSAPLESISDNRSITSDAPDGTRIVQGTAAADASIQLGGESAGYPSLANEWNPFNQSGPLWAKKRIMAPMYADIGFDTANNPASPTFEYVRMFTGRIRLETDVGSAGTVTFQPVDPSSLMKRPVLLPMMTQLGHPGLDGRTFIDLILTANGFDPALQDLEPSLNPLIATPYTGTKQDAWTTIQAIAKAEMAVAFFDELGKFHFWNRNHFLYQTVDYSANPRTVTVNGVTSTIPKVQALRELKDFTIVSAADTVRNHVQVNFNPIIVQPTSWVWQATHIIGIHSRSTETQYCDLDLPAQSIDSTVNVIANGGTTGNHSGYRACSNNDGTGDPIENLIFTVTVLSAQRVKIDIYNPNRRPAYLVAATHAVNGDVFPSGTAGKPFLWLRGRSVGPNPDITTSQTTGSSGVMVEASDAASMNPTSGYGEQVFQYDGGVWLQDGDTAKVLCSDILSMCNRPTPYLDSVQVVGDPRLQIGDRIELIDSAGMPLDEDVFIVGKSGVLSTAQGFAQTLTVKLCAGVGGWILGHPTRSILGSTTILGGVY